MALNRVVRIAGVLVASAAFVAACGSSTATTAPSAAPASAAPSVAAASAAPSAAASAVASAAPAGSAAANATLPPVTLSKDITIGVAFPQIDTFLSTVRDGMQAEADKISAATGHKITLNIQQAYQNGQEDPALQLSQVETFVTSGVAAIIIIPVDTSAAQPMSDAAAKANIPVVYVNRNPKIAGNPYVGSDSLLSGTLEMTQLAKDAKATIATTDPSYKGNVVILEGQTNNEAAVLRTQGCNDVVKQNPGMQVTKTQSGNWMRDQGMSIMENWLQSGDQIDIVCANNDEMALGAIKAIAAANMTGKILVGGVDATADALAAMKAGTLDTTVFQNGKGQGSGGIDAAVLMAGGQAAAVPSYVDVPYVLVTKDNMSQFGG